MCLLLTEKEMYFINVNTYHLKVAADENAGNNNTNNLEGHL